MEDPITGDQPAHPVIRTFLELSTAHLPEHLGSPGGLDHTRGVIAHGTDTGFWLWVPNDPDESAQATTDPVPDVVLAIQRYARARGCDYVRFDADADQVGELPTWDW